MPLSAPQKEVSSNTARFKVCVMGRRWGKSYLAMNEMAKFARHPNQKVFYVAPTYRQAKQIIWDELKEKLLACRWVKKINESDLTIKLVNNSTIYLRSADNPDSLRGVSISFLVMDECAMIDQKTWSEVLRPALSDQKGHALFITTPKGKNWIYDLWQGAKIHDDWAAFQSTTLEGGQVDDAEIEMARNELDEKSFRQEYEATFETYAGAIYYNWDAERNVVKRNEPIPEREILHVAMDFNVTPLVAGIARVTGNEIHFIDEIVMEGSNTYEMADELNHRYPKNRMWVYPDASGQARKTSSNTSDHNILRQAGFTIKAKGINPPVKDRIASVNASLLSANGDVKMTVEPKCKNIIKCISSQVYKEGTQIPDKTMNLDHMNDAVGYLVNWINPIKRPVQKTSGPSLFGHY